MKGWLLHIKGQVQGVGFRPFVYQLATQLGIVGRVSNTHDGLHVHFAGPKTTVNPFIEQILEHPPKLARIRTYELTTIPEIHFTDFQVCESASQEKSTVLLTPDAATCPDCLKELNDPNNSRYQYPFITCTNCGPRYSIIKGLPYDRPETTMDQYSMCPDCASEYQDPSDRRFWSQTNSCSTCGIQQTLYGADQQILSTNDSEILNWVTQAWKAGQIVAIKGIGGFLLTVDATNPEAVQTLRDRKQRPTKPFALMFADMKTIKSNFEVSESQIDQLGYPQASIVLLRNKPYTFKQLALEQIGPGLDQTGVMVAYTPLFQLLLDQFERPIVATSGNVSGSPIVFGNEPALTAFKGIADLILTNDRAIALPQDDSVVRFSPEKLKRIIIRRSRGLAPNYFGPPVFPEVGQAILALGGQLKSGFGLQHEQQTYLSQYLGDLDHFDTQENFQRSLSHLSSVLGFEPEVVLTDLHPAYFTTDFGAQIGQQHQIPVVQIQHHEAHFCAVLGEHDLFDSNAPIMGMVWDGTGLGTDQQIWGSECFLYQDQQIERLGHFDYFPWILNNKMAREPRLSALAICHDLHLAEAVLKPKFSETEWKIYTKRLANNPQLKTSSMGRIFDAMACLLGFKSQQSFEGEAAMLLEQAAQGYLDKHQIIKQANGQLEPYSGGWNTKLLFQEVLEDLATGLSIEYIAAKLHWTLVEVIRASAQKAGVQHIAFSGGVFQNGVLVDLLLHFLSEDFQLYFHKTLSPNDENLAFGQIMWYQWQANKTKVDHSNTKNYVFSNSR